MKSSSKKKVKNWTQRKWLMIASCLHILYAVIYFIAYQNFEAAVYEAIFAYISFQAKSKKGFKYVLYIGGYTVAIVIMGLGPTFRCFEILTYIQLGQII